MYFSFRAMQVRNLAVAAVNGAVTLALLLIAPLGLAAVITNTLLVMVATFATATVADRVVGYLSHGSQPPELRDRSQMRRADRSDLDRF